MGDNWREMIFEDAVDINLPRKILRGEVAPHISMDIVQPFNRTIDYFEMKEFKGSGSRFQNGDTLLARITPCLENGKTAFVSCLPDDAVGHGSTEFIVFSGKKGISDNLFVYYLSREPDFRNYAIQQMEGSTGRQRVPAKALSKLAINLPPLPEQKAIASILGALDDKIELNRQMNETLEAMARALFKSWFVDFDPIPGFSPHKEWQDSPLGKIPKGWRVGNIGNICTVKGGFAYKSETFCDNGYPVIKIKNINADRTISIDDVEYIPEDIALKTRDFWLSDGDLIMAMTGATVGKFGLVINKRLVPAVLNQRVAKFFPFQEHGGLPWFIYGVLQSQEIIEQIITIADGSAQPNISANGIMSPKIIVPQDKLIKLFNTHVGSMFKQLISNQKQSRTLASIRDALLPKLLSGEIRVKDAERFVIEVV